MVIQMVKYDFVHLLNYNSSKFNKSIYDLIMSNDKNSHLFVCRKEKNYKEMEKLTNVIYDSDICNVEGIKKYYYNCNVVVLHGNLYSKKDFIKLDDGFVRRTIWCVWGSDLYENYDTLKSKIYHFCINLYFSISNVNKRYNNKISRLAGVFIGFSGDKFRIRSLYGNDLKIYSALYPSGYFLENIIKHGCLNKTRKRILLGHSSYKFLKHKKYINILKKFSSEIEVVIPLSYGDSKYGKRIKKIAEKNLEHYEIITDFMDSSEYIELIDSIDLAIFDYKHQAAFGNIILLLYLNKKIYLSPKGIMYKGLREEGVKVYSVKDIKNGNFLKDNTINNCVRNYEYSKNLLDYSYISHQWIDALNSVKKEVLK